MQKLERNRRKERIGTVVSNKAQKTVRVEIERRVRHPLYKKFIRKASSLVVHDEENSCMTGDLVRIAETRPLSKTKRWRLVEILKSSSPQ